LGQAFPSAKIPQQIAKGLVGLEQFMSHITGSFFLHSFYNLGTSNSRDSCPNFSFCREMSGIC
jgi:hypothetical protein